MQEPALLTQIFPWNIKIEEANGQELNNPAGETHFIKNHRSSKKLGIASDKKQQLQENEHCFKSRSSHIPEPLKTLQP